MIVGRILVEGRNLSFTLDAMPKDIEDGTYSLVLYSHVKELLSKIDSLEKQIEDYQSKPCNHEWHTESGIDSCPVCRPKQPLKLRLKEAEMALRFYAEGGSDLEPRAEKAHLYDKEYPVGSIQWLKRSMSDYQTGRRARDYFKRWGES